MAGGLGATGGGGAFLAVTIFGTGIGRRSACGGPAGTALPFLAMMLTAPDLTKDFRIRSYKAELNRIHICGLIILLKSQGSTSKTRLLINP